MATIPIKFNSRDDLVKALAAKIPEAIRRDRELLKTHRADAKGKFSAWQRALKASSGVTYQQWLDHAAALDATNRYSDEAAELRGDPRFHGPLEMPSHSCPVSIEAKLRKAMATIEMSSQEQFTIGGEKDSTNLHYLLTFDFVESAVC